MLSSNIHNKANLYRFTNYKLISLLIELQYLVSFFEEVKYLQSQLGIVTNKNFD